jgi:hypothetical protein
VGVGFGLGNEMILIQRSVAGRDLGTATTGVRFAETLGTSVAAAACAALFAVMTAHGQPGPVPGCRPAVRLILPGEPRREARPG